MTLLAAGYKAYNKISYADAFAAALTEQKKAMLITEDKEFKPLEKKNKNSLDIKFYFYGF